MQKVIQRTQRAERAAGRKLAKAREHYEKGESWSRSQTLNRMQRSANANIRNARRARQEDWERGPLAPRRDVGDKKATYGAMSMYDFQLPELDPANRPKWMHISVGDRVVVVNGRHRGRISTVEDVEKSNGSVRVKGLNVVDLSIPEWMQEERGADPEPIHSMPRSFSINDVRLVYPLPDPETGIPRDVVIDRLININYEFDKAKKEWTQGDRLIPGTNTIIPWPEKADEYHEDFENDTLRLNVDEQTFRPFLLHPPMPLSVIDELRNKFSRFRTRHDWDFIERKELEDERVEKRKELAKGMRTPLQELAEVRRKEREEKQRDLSDEQLAKIGEVIAAERAKATQTLRDGSVS
ncbi:hypothetical protein NU195Hw_g4221t1 [Hortaea werneckii]